MGKQNLTPEQRAQKAAHMKEIRAKYPERFNQKINGAATKRAEKKAEKARRKQLAKEAREARQIQSEQTIMPTTNQIPNQSPENVAQIPPTSKAEKSEEKGKAKTSDILPTESIFSPPPKPEPIIADMDELFQKPLTEPEIENIKEKIHDNPKPGNIGQEHEEKNGDPQASGSGPTDGIPQDKAKATGVNRVLATMVWGMIVATCIRIFGQGFQPRVFKNPGGQDLDENENVILAFCDYFDSLGLVKLSPLWNLVLTLASYFLIRINILLDWFEIRRKKQAAMKPSSVRQTPPPRPQPEKAQPRKPESPGTPPEQPTPSAQEPKPEAAQEMFEQEVSYTHDE